MKNLALGRYVPYNTFIHNLDPRVKMFALVVLMVSIFLPLGLLGYAFMMIIIFTLLKITKIQIKSIYRSLKPMWFMMLFLLFFNLLLIKTGPVAFSIFGWKIYVKALTQTLSIFVRLALMISLTTILTVSTKPLELTYAIEFYLTPLKVIKFPAHEIAMTLSIALRFIPTLLEETERIIKAQTSRGVDLVEGKLKEKVKAIIALIIPLFISAFQRSEELANAMEARGYNPSGKRTRYRVLKVGSKDLVGATIVILVLVGAIIISKIPLEIRGIIL